MITDEETVRLIDFGLSKASKKKNLHTIAGTPYYMAPEVLEGNYGTKADIWSLGVLLYTLVSGYLPFQGSSSAEVFRKIKDANFHFKHAEFNEVSDECKDLIRKLLVVKEKSRLSGQEALKHPWFTKYAKKGAENPDNAMSEAVVNRLKSYKGVSHFKRAAMNMLVKMATEDEVRELRKQFQALDEDGSGMILASELSEIIRKKQMNISDNEVKEMINEIDYHGNGKINYSEFLSATINIQTFLTDQKLMAIFSQFDTDSSGRITEENIYLAMQKLGQEIPKQEIKEMIEKHDLTKDGKLSFEEFVCIFKESDKPFGVNGPK